MTCDHLIKKRRILDTRIRLFLLPVIQIFNYGLIVETKLLGLLNVITTSDTSTKLSPVTSVGTYPETKFTELL